MYNTLPLALPIILYCLLPSKRHDAKLRAKYDARQERLVRERRMIAVLHADGKNWL